MKMQYDSSDFYKITMQFPRKKSGNPLENFEKMGYNKVIYCFSIKKAENGRKDAHHASDEQKSQNRTVKLWLNVETRTRVVN